MSEQFTKNTPMMNLETYDSSDPICWTDSQITRLLCSLCFFVVYPPMQMSCCGTRICENCSKKIDKSFQCYWCGSSDSQVIPDRGFKRELEELRINCPKCNNKWNGLFRDLPAHLNDHYDLECNNCEEKFIFPQQLEKHHRVECKKRVVACPLAFLGCLTKIPHSKIAQHYLESEHQQCLLRFITHIIPKYSRGHAKSTFQTNFNEPIQRHLAEYLQKIELLIQEVISMIENCTRLGLERQTMETKVKEIRAQAAKVKEFSDNSAKLLESIEQIFVYIHKVIDEIKSKPMTGPKLLSLDSTYICKFNVAAIINDGRSVQSEPVHTSQSGYKLVLICEMIEQGQKKKRYVSVSFIILRGEFDAILSWPMLYPITISILDLTETKTHIQHSISSDSRTTPFGRPVTDANPPSRIAPFCDVDTLLKNGNKYIQDGFIYLQLHIDFTTASTNPISNKGLLKPTRDYIQTNILQDMA